MGSSGDAEHPEVRPNLQGTLFPQMSRRTEMICHVTKEWKVG